MITSDQSIKGWRFCLDRAAFFFDRHVALGGATIGPRLLGVCFHLSPCYTEMEKEVSRHNVLATLV
jgi:hypothetical protein